MADGLKMEERYERNGWPSLARPDIKAPEGWNIPLLTGINRVYNHSLSPNGRHIAFIWNREGFSDIYIIPANGGWPRRITFDRPAKQYWWDEIPRWSPDGNWLAFCMNKQVYIVPISGSIPRKLSSIVHSGCSPRWMPDGEHLVVTVEHEEADRLYIIDREGGNLQALTDFTGDARDPQPSPDGKWVAYTHRSFADLNRYEIRIVEVATGKVQALTGEHMQKDWNPHWSPDSTKIAFNSHRSGYQEIWISEIGTDKLFQLTHVGLDLGDVQWSPDGKWLVVTTNKDGVLDLELVNAESGEMTTFRKRDGVHTNMNWSPQSDFMTVEYSDPAQPPDIFRLNLSMNDAGRFEIRDTIQLTFSKPPALDKLDMVFPEKVTYRSYDNTKIPALLYKPKKPNGAAIVHPHGGPRDQGTFEWQIFVQYLVAKGYTYLDVNYRGSTGYGKKYEFLNQNAWGTGDTQDCVYGAKYLSNLDYVDKDMIAIMGGSYGGYLTICSLSRDSEHRFACGIVNYGDADLFSSWALCERDTRLYTEMQLGHPAMNRKVYVEGSPIYQVEKINKPMLILHGLEDEVVPPQASEVLVEALRRAGKTYEYKTYAQESHGFLRNEVIQDVYARIERFLDWYLLPRP